MSERVGKTFSKDGNWEVHREEIETLQTVAEEAYVRKAAEAGMARDEARMAFYEACTTFAFALMADEALERQMRTGIKTDQEGIRDLFRKQLEWHILTFSTPSKDMSPHRGNMTQILDFFKKIRDTGALPQ